MSLSSKPSRRDEARNSSPLDFGVDSIFVDRLVSSEWIAKFVELRSNFSTVFADSLEDLFRQFYFVGRTDCANKQNANGEVSTDIDCPSVETKNSSRFVYLFETMAELVYQQCWTSASSYGVTEMCNITSITDWKFERAIWRENGSAATVQRD